jgi:hypothetical protein
LVYLSTWPKHEIFEHGVFTQIRPVWIGDIGSRQKIQNLCLRPYITLYFPGFCFSVFGNSAKKIINSYLYSGSNLFLFGLKRHFFSVVGDSGKFVKALLPTALLKICSVVAYSAKKTAFLKIFCNAVTINPCSLIYSPPWISCKHIEAEFKTLEHRRYHT